MTKNKETSVKVVTFFENKQSITQAFGKVILNNIKTKHEDMLVKSADKSIMIIER